MLGAIAVATAVQAASVNWTITGVPASDSASDKSTYTALLYITEGAGTLGSTFTTVSMEDVIASLKGTSVATGYVVSKNLNAAGAVAGNTGLGSTFAAGDSLTAFAVILDGGIDSYDNYIVTGTKSVTFTSSTGAQTLGFGAQSSATWTSAVPEPTSGLLMLLGVAGLALRRRRA